MGDITTSRVLCDLGVSVSLIPYSIFKRLQVVKIEEDAKMPLILGHSFLAMAGAMIDVKNGKLLLQVKEEKFEL